MLEVTTHNEVDKQFQSNKNKVSCDLRPRDTNLTGQLRADHSLLFPILENTQHIHFLPLLALAKSPPPLPPLFLFPLCYKMCWSHQWRSERKWLIVLQPLQQQQTHTLLTDWLRERYRVLNAISQHTARINHIYTWVCCTCSVHVCSDERPAREAQIGHWDKVVILCFAPARQQCASAVLFTSNVLLRPAPLVPAKWKSAPSSKLLTSYSFCFAVETVCKQHTHTHIAICPGTYCREGDCNQRNTRPQRKWMPPNNCILFQTSALMDSILTQVAKNSDFIEKTSVQLESKEYGLRVKNSVVHFPIL